MTIKLALKKHKNKKIHNNFSSTVEQSCKIFFIHTPKNVSSVFEYVLYSHVLYSNMFYTFYTSLNQDFYFKSIHH